MRTYFLTLVLRFLASPRPGPVGCFCIYQVSIKFHTAFITINSEAVFIFLLYFHIFYHSKQYS